MFNRLTDFGYQRNTKEAIGFYITYLVLIVVLAFIIGSIFDPFLGENAFDVGINIGSSFAIIASLVISFLILKEKRLLVNIGLVFLVLLAGVLAVFIGGLGGLIPAAYLTTKKKSKK